MTAIKCGEKHPKGKISENKFRYHTKLEVYANKNSAIKELGEIKMREDLYG